MKAVLCLVGMVLLVVLHGSYAPPVNPDKKEEDSEISDNLEKYIEYQRYLQEVVQALESDPTFRERLEKADEEDVRSGKIAEHLDFLGHNVRTKLDEIKRREMERLRHLAKKQFELDNEIETDPAHHGSKHLDQSNPHTFEIEDLKRLIKQTTADLEAADKQRKQEFKEYEMKKEFEKHQKLESMDEIHKAEYEAQLKKEQEALKHHQPLHHPATREQLLEIWKSADKMDPNDFDPKAFFMLHDVDGNGVWDADEVKALFIKELDKLYGPGGPNKDLHERAEEMERMREHVFQENDKNRDGLIDFHEFMMETKRPEFNEDEGWRSIDENQIYTQNEYQEFERRKLEELRYLQSLGLVDAHGRPLPGAEHQIHKAVQQFAAQYHPDRYPPPYPPGQPQYQQPPQYQQQPPQYQQQPPQYQQQPPQYQQQHPQFQQQPPQFQQVPQPQIPQGQYHGQAPQAQNQGPQGQYQGQAAQAQVPQGHAPQNQGQVPQVPQNNQGQIMQAQGQQGQGQQGQGQGQQGQGQGQQGQGQGQQAQGQGQQGQGQGQQGQAQGQQGQAQGQQGQAQGQQGQAQGQQGQAQGQQGQAQQLQGPQGPAQREYGNAERIPGEVRLEPSPNGDHEFMAPSMRPI